MGNYNNRDVTYIVKWYINDEKSEEHTISVTDAGDKDPEKKWYSIDIKEFGEKPVLLGEGDKVDCCVRC